VTLIALSGANPSRQLPLGRLIQRRGDLLSAAVEKRLEGRADVVTAWNWPDLELGSPAYWSDDRLHMNARGHHRVAARVLTALGLDAPAAWWTMPPQARAAIGTAAYYRAHVVPWVRRRLTGTSSGDGRTAKFAHWQSIVPVA
jgi:hypothetical protein